MSGSPLRTSLQVPLSHPMFDGHFPGHPVVPGAWLLAQAIGALEAIAGTPFAWQHVHSAKFHAPVPPGARLDLSLAQSPSSGWQLTIHRAGELAVSVLFAGAPAEQAPCTR
jgi:3-hydroxymyristoyl/3-hydroxydecanoyl-(acyl carrier protein) dehydratase